MSITYQVVTCCEMRDTGAKVRVWRSRDKFVDELDTDVMDRMSVIPVWASMEEVIEELVKLPGVVKIELTNKYGHGAIVLYDPPTV